MMKTWLREAVHLAVANARAGDYPFGALVVRDGTVLATGVNTARRYADPTAHAEIEAIRSASRRVGSLTLDGAIVVSSCQPCPLCQALASLAGVPRIVYAATAEMAADAGFALPPAAAAMAAATRDAAGVELEYVETPDAEAPFAAWAAWTAAAAVTGATGVDAPAASDVASHAVSELRLAVTVDDFDGAIAFYRDVFGLPEIEGWATPQGRGAVLDAGRATLELIDSGQAELIDAVEVGRRVAGPIRVALEVADSTTMGERLTAAGAAHLGEGPVITPWRHRNVRLAAPGDLQLTLFTVLPPEGSDPTDGPRPPRPPDPPDGARPSGPPEPNGP
jgi:tRNA(Arg) A34 adenosine deaminase TadA/catechol 2,3-dioxygenase-like lactoylglutathione lyase family enzyme